MNCDQNTEMGSIGKTRESDHRLIPDGGEENSEEEHSDEETEVENGNDEETTVLYLDLEGLFLDLLGLEVDLNEVVLDVSAVPGSGKLLGNLLSAVARLLDDGLSDLLGNLLPTDALPSVSDVLPDFDDISVSGTFFTVLNQVLDELIEALEDTDASGSNDSSE